MQVNIIFIFLKENYCMWWPNPVVCPWCTWLDFSLSGVSLTKFLFLPGSNFNYVICTLAHPTQHWWKYTPYTVIWWFEYKCTPQAFPFFRHTAYFNVLFLPFSSWWVILLWVWCVKLDQCGTQYWHRAHVRWARCLGVHRQKNNECPSWGGSWAETKKGKTCRKRSKSFSGTCKFI